ncbi:MAG TPA: 50S ribosomal protein L25, partial [Chlamydiales bacterium]|nr:50S ribosomal protein L25 [Chlamydiales bacterium]
MKLKIFKRTGEKKSDVRRLRFTGEIPAVIYGARRKSENIKLNEAEFQALMRDLKPGRLPTTLFELHYDKEVLKAVVRDIQYHRTNYRILHIDFGILEPDLPVTVNVPIIYQGVA